MSENLADAFLEGKSSKMHPVPTSGNTVGDGCLSR